MKYLTVRRLARSRHQKRIDRVVDISEVAQLTPLPNLELPALDQRPDPQTEKCLPSVLHSHPRPVGVGQSQSTGANAVNIIVEDMVPLARHLVDAVHVYGPAQMPLVNRQIIGLAIELAGTG